MYNARKNITNSYRDFVLNYSLLLNLGNFESDFCRLSEPETGHVIVSYDDKD